jgi:hypothetical protein
VYKKSKGRVPEMLSRAAERGARESEAAEAADSKLDVRIKVLVLGMSGGWVRPGSQQDVRMLGRVEMQAGISAASAKGSSNLSK